jgi:hypothetical protein
MSWTRISEQCPAPTRRSFAPKRIGIAGPARAFPAGTAPKADPARFSGRASIRCWISWRQSAAGRGRYAELMPAPGRQGLRAVADRPRTARARRAAEIWSINAGGLENDWAAQAAGIAPQALQISRFPPMPPERMQQTRVLRQHGFTLDQIKHLFERI